MAFDIVYYIFGSPFGYKSSRVIYVFLDWGRAPGRAVTITLFLLLLGLPLSHGLHVLIAAGRERLRRMYPDLGWQVCRQRGRGGGRGSLVFGYDARPADRGRRRSGLARCLSENLAWHGTARHETIDGIYRSTGLAPDKR